jgi:hypothetical protein
VEFGTKKQGMHAFMRPAFQSKREAATEAIRSYLAARIEKEAAKII